MEQIFFQSSLPRAGSTLLQNIMGQNPDFYVTPTSGIMSLIQSTKDTFNNNPDFKAQDKEEMKKAYLGFCNQGLHGYFNNITNSKYVLDKSRGWGINYDFLNSYYPNPKIVCIVRDLRAVYTSFEKLWRSEPEKSGNFNNGETIRERIDFQADNGLAGSSIKRIKEVIDLKNDTKFHFLRFEDLTDNPQNEINKIYDFFQIERYENHDFNNVKQLTYEDDKFHGINGLHDIRQKVQPVENQWDHILGNENSDAIYNTYPWFNEYFKYEL
tara:strand:+ start:2331 stop:3137 length:807 start_codon:yes stop_codon:yes gene_type:complete